MYLLELSPKLTQRQRRDQLGAWLAQAKDLDDITEPLGLADHTSVRDDVALLFLQHQEKA